LEPFRRATGPNSGPRFFTQPGSHYLIVEEPEVPKVRRILVNSIPCPSRYELGSGLLRQRALPGQIRHSPRAQARGLLFTLLVLGCGVNIIIYFSNLSHFSNVTLLAGIGSNDRIRQITTGSRALPVSSNLTLNVVLCKRRGSNPRPLPWQQIEGR
jgi:hypothetical protein